MTASLARRILGAAIALGVLADLLVDGGVLRLGFAIWAVVLAATALAVTRSTDARRNRERGVLLGIAALASIGFVFRDSETLLAFNLLTALAMIGFVVWVARGRSLTELRLGDLIIGAGATFVGFVAGALRLGVKDAAWGDAASASGQKARYAVVGAVASIPLLLITVSLLGEADPIFGALLDNIAAFLSEELLQHTVGITVVAWFVAGWMRSSVDPDIPELEGAIPSLSRVPMAGLAPALYAMIVLLAAFLGLQARTLFGNAAMVERTSGLSYADYARGGFFELVAVAMLVLLLLLAADALLDRTEEGGERRFRSAGWVLVGLVAILAASALHRMRLYLQAYEWSEQRLLAIAGMVWIIAALGWFGASVLRGRRAGFTLGLGVLTVVWVLALNVLSPDAFVARVNLATARAGGRFDPVYHAKLSADAFPILARGAASLPRAHCVALLDGLRARKFVDGAMGWKDWNLPIARVQVITAPGSTFLDASRCPTE